MKSNRHIAVMIFLLCNLQAWASDAPLPIGDTDACMQGPLAQFGRYIGAWDIEDWSLSDDGQEWSEGDGGRWSFVCVGNGTAIQDFWMPNGGDIGTNLRTYNPTTGSWDIVWAMPPMPGFARISAKLVAEGSIVMHFVSPQPEAERRITFYPPQNDGWNWKMEFSKDEGESWTEVYRIRATRGPIASTAKACDRSHRQD